MTLKQALATSQEENARLYDEISRLNAQVQRLTQEHARAVAKAAELEKRLQKETAEHAELANFLQKQYGKTFDVAHERGIIMHALAREIERLRGREDTV